jgi:hypothetical protein
MVATFENIHITMMLWSWNVLQIHLFLNTSRIEKLMHGNIIPDSVSVHLPYSVSVQIPNSVSVQLPYSVGVQMPYSVSVHMP